MSEGPERFSPANTEGLAPLHLVRESSQRGLSWAGLALIGVIYASMVCWYAVWRAERSTDFRDFWRTALEFRQTGEVVSDLGVHNYLPAFTILMTPFSFLPLKAAIVLFNVLSLCAFAATVVLAEKLLVGKLPPKPRPATLIAITFILPYVHSCVTLGQLGLVLLFLCVAGYYAVQRGRQILGGGLIGLATVLKILPAALLLYFLLRRKFRAFAAGMTVALLLAFGLPALFVGWSETAALHGDFYERAIKAGGAWATISAETPTKAKFTNNAVPVVLRRLLSPVNGDAGPEGRELFVNFANLPRTAIGTIYGLLIVIILGASIWATLKSKPPSNDNGRRFAIWCAAMLLLSPLVWTHYLVLMYWPIAYLVDRYDAQGRGAARRARMVPIALLIWIAAAVLLAWPAARAAGAQIAAVSMVWMGLVFRPMGTVEVEK